MRLFFDIGNTRLKWVVEAQESSVELSGSVLYAKKGWSELDQLNDIGVVTEIWASSVASRDTQLTVEAWVKENFDLGINWLSVDDVACGVRNTYQPLSQLGVDRWAAVLGARQYLLKNNFNDTAAIVVDAGTAVTVDVLTNDFVFQGGAILPGLNMMHDALVGETQGIDSSFVGGLVVPGKNTQQCVNAGVHYALLGAVERLVVEMQGALSLSDFNVVLILTGGDARLIKQNSNLKFVVLPKLVIDGLKCVADSSEN